MKRPVYISGGGAVTAAGLTAQQTLCAIRAGLSAFEETSLFQPLGESQIVARIPAHWRLRETFGDWLVNMAVRAIDEALADNADTSSTALLLTPPETFRRHPALAELPPAQFLTRVIHETGRTFHPSSRAIDGGAAANIALVQRALELMETQGVTQVLLGGVDSLVNEIDLLRLKNANRLKKNVNAQGLVPGEGAVFVRLTLSPANQAATLVAVRGVGTAQEADSVLTERHSQGRALLAALRAATTAPSPGEPEIGLVISNSNGERYSAWEQLIAHPRFYRTRREQRVVAYPAMTIGEIGSAAGALSLLLAADSLNKGYSPGTITLCETASESGMRAAVTIVGVQRR
jgi:3-oxoacyl-[acyl-carrier-protein] synthase-1